MAKFRMKLVGKADIYRFVEVEAADLDAAIDLAEGTYNTDEPSLLDGWIVDEVVTHGPDAVRVVTGSWRQIDA